MGEKTVAVTLGTKGVNKLISLCDEMLAQIHAVDPALASIAEVGRSELSAAYSAEDKPVSVRVDKTAQGYELVAEGEGVTFLEFGAGVHYNTPDPYSGERPPGIVGIGEYGHGYGKNKFWKYYGDDGELHYSWGNPAAMGFIKARNAMVAAAPKLLRKK
jgi:hypothetical protein